MKIEDKIERLERLELLLKETDEWFKYNKDALMFEYGLYDSEFQNNLKYLVRAAAESLNQRYAEQARAERAKERK